MNMKESSDSGPSISASVPSPSSRSATPKRESSDSGSSIAKTGYKFWVLAAILLLAFWSMLTGSVTLKWSSVTTNLHRFSDEPKLAVSGDVDVLEVEERERLVRKMWDLYSHGSTARLPRFWLEAFQAGYEQMVSDAPAVRDGAVSEIAKMSLLSIPLDSLPLRSGVEGKLARKWRKAMR